MGNIMQIPIKVNSDEKGYLDRECPNCEYQFKTNVQDWEEKISNKEMYCLKCGHINDSDEWWTQEH